MSVPGLRRVAWEGKGTYCGLDTDFRRNHEDRGRTAALCRLRGVEFRPAIRGAADDGQVPASAIRRFGRSLDRLHAVLPGGAAAGIPLLLLPDAISWRQGTGPGAPRPADAQRGRAAAEDRAWKRLAAVPQSRSCLCWRRRWACRTSHCRATSPLLQSWLAAPRGEHFPYRLFALSNAASLLALLAYPVAIEPFLSTRAADGLLVRRLRRAAVPAGRGGGWQSAPGTSGGLDRSPGSEHRPWLWIALAACASTLWLAIANYLGQQVAAMPFLWVVPMAIYLLSFILCFEADGWYRPALFRWLMPVAWIAIGSRIALEGSAGGLQWEIPIFSRGAVHLLHVLPRRTGAQQASRRNTDWRSSTSWWPREARWAASSSGWSRRTSFRLSWSFRSELRRRSFWRSTSSSDSVPRGD